MVEARSVRSKAILRDYYYNYCKKIDAIMVFAFALHYAAAVLFALYVSPKTWVGGESFVHLHIYAAIIIGGLTAGLPAFLCWKFPGHKSNRYAVAIGLMVYSVLLIHLSGGRIETHFHVFGALALIAFYRDPGPLLLATLITAIDHFSRGAFWPESVYGVLVATPWRAAEHAAWVVFEDTFLLMSIRVGWQEMKTLANQQVDVEELADYRAMQLNETLGVVEQQQVALANSAKLSALGEMAGSIAHEINTPLSVITLRSDRLNEKISHGQLEVEEIQSGLNAIRDTTFRIAKIVKGLKSFARQGGTDPMVSTPIINIVESTLGLCQEKLKNHGVVIENLIVDSEIKFEEIECREVEISQVLLNLINNADHAQEGCDNKWIRIEAFAQGEYLEIHVSDGGPGIPDEVRGEILKPFFTTKELGKGTGLGLSLSKGICEAHGGDLIIDACPRPTKFIIKLKKRHSSENGLGYDEYKKAS